MILSKYLKTQILVLFEPEPIKENKTIKDIRKENSNTDEILKDKGAHFEPEETIINRQELTVRWIIIISNMKIIEIKGEHY